MPEDTQTVTKKQSALWTIPPNWEGVSGGISDTSDGILAWGRASVADVASNRIKWTEKLGLVHLEAITLEQVHEARVVKVDRTLCGSGIIDPTTRIPSSDGMITNDPAVLLVTSHADCAPIYLYHPGAKAIGLVHAGWRSTLAGIASIAVGEMSREFSLKPEKIQVSVGPMITTSNYEVGDDVAEKFVSKFGPSIIVKLGGKPHLDVFASIIIDLMRTGVATARFCPRPPDTYSDLRWSSFRRDGERAGGMLAYFKLK
ncbi:MAG: polyphenol oxidase family protein [bacterium]|nr:polyphenol oxidase family protein [bacterium]